MAAPPQPPADSREDVMTAVYQEIKGALVSKVLPSYDIAPDAATWASDAIAYNVPGGKLHRGLCVVRTVFTIRGDATTDHEARLAAIAGWCLEWMQASFIVADDIKGASITRRNQPCWYKQPAVGLIAFNDSCMLLGEVFVILKREFRAEPCYVDLIELFNEAVWQRGLGRLMDLTTQPQPAAGPIIDLDRFTLERYRQIVKHKTAFYSFYMPVVCGLMLVGRATETAKAQALDILLDMGEYFQIQEDVLNCFAPAKALGKIGTDIQDNQCTWLVVQALALANDTQRASLKVNYGRHDSTAVAVVKALYMELGLEARFRALEIEAYARIRAKVDAATATSNVPAEVYLSLLQKIYKRSQ